MVCGWRRTVACFCPQHYPSPCHYCLYQYCLVWEIGIKSSIGKLPLTNSLLGLEAIARSQSIKILPITVQEINLIQQFSHHHKDLFDRIIAASTLTTGGVLLSADPIFASYSVSTVWGGK